MIPRAGGPYVFTRRAYGEFGGFIAGWSDWFLNTLSLSLISVAAAEYAGVLFPLLSERVSLTAVSIILFFGGLHWLGVEAGAGAQKLMSLVKVAAFLALVAACFVYGGTGSAVRSADPGPAGGGLLSLAAVIISVQFVIETYGGYNSAVYFSEENTNSARNIPRALFVGVLLVMAVYVLVNLAILNVLSIPEIAESKLPVADAAERLFGGNGGTIVTALSLISLLGIINATSMLSPRVMFGLARDGLFVPQAALVSRGGTPYVALLVTVATAVGLAFAGSFETLFAIAAFLGVSLDASVFVALFVLRKTEPDTPRPFRAIGYPFLPLIAAGVALTLLAAFVYGNTQNSLVSIAAIVVSYPLYLIVRRHLSKNAID
jgi:APA family basic amino acid/polyamine antiporter